MLYNISNTVYLFLQVNTGGLKVTQAALGVDHSVFLVAGGGVMTCGLNTSGQLGQGPLGASVATPTAIKLKPDVVPVGVAAARYHSVFWTASDVYTCGMNGGESSLLFTCSPSLCNK